MPNFCIFFIEKVNVKNMKALVINRIKDLAATQSPLSLINLPEPQPNENELLVKVSTCGVCHTELDEIEGRTPPPFLPVVPGHQIVGYVADKGAKITKFNIGERIGIGWINSSCGKCGFCKRGDDNLCAGFKATGRDVNGGYTEYTTINENYAFSIPEYLSDAEAAPLLCAGAIGYRSLRLAQLKENYVLGLTGFGSSAHLVLKLAKHLYPNSKIFVFARSEKEREFAKELGADWAGDTGDEPPQKINAIIDTTPVWKPIVKAMENLVPGGRLVINAIRKEEADKQVLLELNYEKHLWMEKEIKSVANVARRDIAEFLNFAAQLKIKPEVEEYKLENANRALTELKERKIRGAKVIVI